MKLVTIDIPPQGRAGLIVDDHVLDIGLAEDLDPLARWAPASLLEVIKGGPQALLMMQRLEGAVRAASAELRCNLVKRRILLPAASARLLAPIPRPGILLSHARAYRSHVQEMKPGEREPDQPIGFLKNSNSIIGTGDIIRLPRAAPAMVDFEAEISVVFSRACHGVSEADAMKYVLGYTIVNDVSARDWIIDMSKHPDLNRMGKQFATFAPMGPCIATPDEIPDVQSIRLVTRLNGEVMQDATTSNLIWSIPQLIAYYSRWYPFQAGDVLTSGSPAGVGYGRNPKLFMKAGDVVSITVNGIGELVNTIGAIQD